VASLVIGTYSDGYFPVRKELIYAVPLRAIVNLIGRLKAAVTTADGNVLRCVHLVLPFYHLHRSFPARILCVCVCVCIYIYIYIYEGGPKNNRNRPVAHACFLVTSCAAR
jgi:hypothetical protein